MKGRKGVWNQADFLQTFPPDSSFFPNDEDTNSSPEEGEPIPGSVDGDRFEEERESNGSEGSRSEEEGRDVLVRGRRREGSGMRDWVAKGELEDLGEDLDGEGRRLRGEGRGRGGGGGSGLL